MRPSAAAARTSNKGSPGPAGRMASANHLGPLLRGAALMHRQSAEGTLPREAEECFPPQNCILLRKTPRPTGKAGRYESSQRACGPSDTSHRFVDGVGPLLRGAAFFRAQGRGVTASGRQDPFPAEEQAGNTPRPRWRWPGQSAAGTLPAAGASPPPHSTQTRTPPARTAPPAAK